jgi:hypothetical protein
MIQDFMSLSHGGGGTSFVSSQYFVGTFKWVGISKPSFLDRFFNWIVTNPEEKRIKTF